MDTYKMKNHRITTKKHPCQVQKLSRGVLLLIQNGPCPMQEVVPNAVPIAVRILTSI